MLEYCEDEKFALSDEDVKNRMEHEINIVKRVAENRKKRFSEFFDEDTSSEYQNTPEFIDDMGKLLRVMTEHSIEHGNVKLMMWAISVLVLCGEGNLLRKEVKALTRLFEGEITPGALTAGLLSLQYHHTHTRHTRYSFAALLEALVDAENELELSDIDGAPVDMFLELIHERIIVFLECEDES